MFVSCAEEYTPKPRAFIKLKFPEKKFHTIESPCPCLFEIAIQKILKSVTQHVKKIPLIMI